MQSFYTSRRELIPATQHRILIQSHHPPLPLLQHAKPLAFDLHQIIVRTITPTPITPSTPHREKPLLEAAPSKSATEGVGDAIDGDVELDTVVLPVAVTKIPPAIAGGEMVLALRAAAW